MAEQSQEAVGRSALGPNAFRLVLSFADDDLRVEQFIEQLSLAAADQPE